MSTKAATPRVSARAQLKAHVMAALAQGILSNPSLSVGEVLWDKMLPDVAKAAETILQAAAQ